MSSVAPSVNVPSGRTSLYSYAQALVIIPTTRIVTNCLAAALSTAATGVLRSRKPQYHIRIGAQPEKLAPNAQRQYRLRPSNVRFARPLSKNPDP